MSKNSYLAKTSLLFFTVAAVSIPVYAVAQNGATLDDVMLELEVDQSAESQVEPTDTMPVENDSVIINPIEEAAPQPVAKSPRVPEEISVEPDAPLAPPENIEETEALDADIDVVDAEPQTEIPHSGLYYDSDAIAGTSPYAPTAPRQVDPKYEPGSRFVVVEKGASAGSTQAQLTAAQRALKLKRYSAALDLFENLYKKTPNSRPVLMGLAVAQQNNGFVESAIATYEELLEIDPNNVDATVNMLGLMKSRYPAIAFRRLKELWEENPENAAIAAQLGMTSAATGNTRDALRYLGIAVSLDPQNASLYYNIAVLSDRAGATLDAIEMYQKALEMDITYAGGKSIPREQIYDRLAYLRRL